MLGCDWLVREEEGAGSIFEFRKWIATKGNFAVTGPIHRTAQALSHRWGLLECSPSFTVLTGRAVISETKEDCQCFKSMCTQRFGGSSCFKFRGSETTL